MAGTGRTFWKAAAGIAVLAVGWLLFQGLAAAHVHEGHRHEPVPGVRATTWKRGRDLPPRAEDGMAVHRATFRPTRRYFGPAASEEELGRYRAAGLSGAFYDHLLPEWRERVDAALADLHAVLDELADAAEDAIEEAKRRIRGTEDEFVHRADRTREENREAARAFLARAKAARDLCVSDSYGGVMRNYRIRRKLHPLVYQLRGQDAELNEIRQQRLREEMEALFEQEGLRVLDVAAMDRAWAETLAGARR